MLTFMAIVALILTVVIFIFLLPKWRDGTFGNKFFQFVHDYFNFKQIYIEYILKFIYIFECFCKHSNLCYFFRSVIKCRNNRHSYDKLVCFLCYLFGIFKYYTVSQWYNSVENHRESPPADDICAL